MWPEVSKVGRLPDLLRYGGALGASAGIRGSLRLWRYWPVPGHNLSRFCRGVGIQRLDHDDGPVGFCMCSRKGEKRGVEEVRGDGCVSI
jgi:hypothetical protein